MNAQTAVVVHDQPQTEGNALMALINRAATDANFDVSKLQALLAVKKEWDADEARKAFVVAMNTFKSSPVWISKNKDVDFQSSKGRTHYRHATLDNVCDVLVPALSAVGISHRWDTEQLDGGAVRVTCVLTHSLGHSERTPLQSAKDESGGKNSIQALGSAVTYLQRYTFLAATGMAVHEQDDDGRSTAESTRPKKLSEEAWDNCTDEEREFLTGIATAVIEFIAAGDPLKAADYIDSQKLGQEEYTALWSQFDSKQRSTIKKSKQERAQAKMQISISDAQKKRLEARIGEVKADREEVKAYCEKTWGKLHFADLSGEEYKALDAILDRKAQAAAEATKATVI